MSAGSDPLIDEPSAILVGGSWHIRSNLGAGDVEKSAAATRSFLRSQHGYWRWLKKPMLIWGILFFLACLAALAMLAAGLTYSLTSDYVPEAFASTFFPLLFGFYVVLAQLILVLIVRLTNRARGKPHVYPVVQIVSTEAIISELPGLKSELLWQQVSDFVDAKEYFLLLHHGAYFTSIPKRAFSGADALKDFADFCMRNWAANRALTSRLWVPA